MIRGRCKTNLDEYKMEYWPEWFVAVPREGEWVLSQGGRCLKVCKVTHCIIKDIYSPFWDENLKGQPYIEVELTKRV